MIVTVMIIVTVIHHDIIIVIIIITIITGFLLKATKCTTRTPYRKIIWANSVRNKMSLHP